MEEKILSYLSFWCSSKNDKFPDKTFRLFYAGNELRFENIKDYQKAINYLVSKRQKFSLEIGD